MGGECGRGWCLGGWCAFRWVVVAFVEALIVGFGECLGGVREEEGEGEREKKGAQGLLPRWAGAVNHALSKRGEALVFGHPVSVIHSSSRSRRYEGRERVSRRYEGRE